VGDGVGVITLNRPAKLNTISARPGGTRDQILAAIELAERDSRVGCILLTGAGRAFSAGGDLSGAKPREAETEHRAFLEQSRRFHHRISSADLPVIAAVHGYCLGAGVVLAAACDLVIAASGATFGFPEGRLGRAGATTLTPPGGRPWAEFLVLTGESISADQARAIGLVLAVEADDELHDRARALATRISRMPREAVLLNRRAIDATADAAGDAAALAAAFDGDVATLLASSRAAAPDGRTFRSILAEEGIDGVKRARAAQYDTPWLSR
jgi:enoyl-CoA hydratase/carnithine racemase